MHYVRDMDEAKNKAEALKASGYETELIDLTKAKKKDAKVGVEVWARMITSL